MIELFAKSLVMGTFKGFADRGYEFAAEIVAPYDSSMLDRPQLGQFVLIELASVEEAALGRITKFVPTGLLSSGEGEDYINTMQERGYEIPEDLKRHKLKYRVQIKLLGAVRVEGASGAARIVFVPSQRRLPHLGAPVAFPSSEVLSEICGLSGGNTTLGHYVLGEFVFDGGRNGTSDPIFRVMSPELPITFDVNGLVARRTVVFARAGYGKSNLIKYLIAELYRNGAPATERGQQVGTLIFDPEGEYFWPDHYPRPGLCDVPHLRDKILLFTNRQRDRSKAYYESWKAGGVRLDIRDLPPRDVVGIAISPDRQIQQNVIKLRSVSQDNWRRLVDLIYRDKLAADDAQVAEYLGYTGESSNRNTYAAEVAAAKSNMNNVVAQLHDPDSQLVNGTLEGLRAGKVVIVDISMLSSTSGFNVAGIILRKIFSFNQEHFTGGQAPIPVVAVLEEAQSVLGRNLDDTSPFVEWAKEGRKYDLGAILVTQQPGAIAPELLSQADNWFSFHLLSEGDAGVLSKYNSHFSSDVVAHLIGEPIPGNCYMWSAPRQPFVLPVRVLDFSRLYENYIETDPAADAYANSAALALRRLAEEKLDRYTTELREEIISEKRSEKLGIRKLGDDLYGIKEGKVYYLIKEFLPPDETRDVNELKRLLMARLFGEENLRIEKHEGTTWFAAHEAAWRTVVQSDI